MNKSHHIRREFAWRWVRPLAASATIVATAAVHGNAQVSLTTVVDLAQRNSTAVRMALADVSKAQAQFSESKDVVIPSIELGTGIPAFPEEGFTGQPPSLWNVTIQSLAFSVPQKHYIDAARQGLQAASSKLKDEREQIALDASTEYIELDAVNEELQSANQQAGFAARLVSIEQQRTEGGVDPLSELLEARLTAANLRLKQLHLEARAATLTKELSELTGLPETSITTEHASIPEIPQVNGDPAGRPLPGIQAAESIAKAKAATAKGDEDLNFLPQLSFFLQYNRNTTVLNNVNYFFAHPLPPNNISSGFSVQIPLFDMEHRAKAHESAADALRARVEAEDAERQNEIQIAQLNGSIRELDTMAEIASLKQQIASEQLKSVLAQLELGNGTGSGPGSTPQLSPKEEQRARINVSERAQESLDSSFELAKARLGLLRALGHMQDWLNELNAKKP